jgi:hypothetical protein
MRIPLAAAALLAGGAAFAQPDPAALVEKKSNFLTFALTVGQLDADFYVRAAATMDLTVGPVGLGVHAPLNLLICETDLVACGYGQPNTRRAQNTHLFLIRKADWDEPDDFTSILRYVRIGRERDWLYAIGGALTNVNVGHGTLMNRYANFTSFDHPRFGINFESNFPQGGTEGVVDALLLPKVFGGRIHFRPFNLGEKPNEVLGSIAFGGTFITDREAPAAVEWAKDEAGNIIYEKVGADGATVGCSAGEEGCEPKINVDATRNPEGAAAWFWGTGFDFEITAVHTQVLDFIPYLDINVLKDETATATGGGVPIGGIHAGSLVNFTLGAGAGPELKLSGRLEYRLMTPGYLPGYFDRFYEMQRWRYPVAGLPGTPNLPKRAAVAHLKGVTSGPQHGFYGEAVADIGGFLQVGAIFEDLQGPLNGTLGIYANLPQLSIVTAEAYYWRKNFEGFGEILGLDERSLLMARVRLSIFGPFGVRASFQQTWQADPFTGQIIPQRKWDFGADATFPF